MNIKRGPRAGRGAIGEDPGQRPRVAHDAPKARGSKIGALLFLGLLACGGADSNAKVSALSDADKRSLCEEGYAAAGSVTEIDCTGLKIKVPSVDECVTRSAVNDCTVGEQRKCYDALGGDACNLTSEACIALLSCVRVSGS